MNNNDKYTNYDKQNAIKESCKHDFEFVDFSPVTYKAEYKCSKCPKVKHIQFITAVNQEY